MDRYVVTGGAGFIGSNICRRLVSEGCFVRVIDNLSTGHLRNLDGIMDKIEFVQADMGDRDVARRAMEGVDVVLHQGALPSVPKSIEDPAATHRHCVEATFNLLLAARDAGIRRFVYAASSSAYGESPTLPKVETMHTAPVSPYAVAKLTGEYYCKVFYTVYGLETISLRYFNIFGPHQDPTSQYAAAIPAFVTAILNDTPPTVYGDGLQRITVNDVIAHVNRCLGKNIDPVYAPTRPGDVKHSLADITLAERVIGYKPVVRFAEGLEKAIEWYRCNLL